MYFTQDTQKAILQYNQETDQLKKSILFSREIYPVLDKLVENIIHTWKFHNYETTYEDLKSDVVTYMVEKLPKYTEKQGKAYSFLTVVAKNFLIQKIKKQVKRNSSLTNLEVYELEGIAVNSYNREEMKTQLQEFIELWVEKVDGQINKLFTSQRDKRIADAILTLFKNCEDIEDFSKKKLYVLVREHAGMNDQQHITRVMSVLKHKFKNEYAAYRELV